MMSKQICSSTGISVHIGFGFFLCFFFRVNLNLKISPRSDCSNLGIIFILKNKLPIGNKKYKNCET